MSGAAAQRRNAIAEKARKKARRSFMAVLRGNIFETEAERYQESEAGQKNGLATRLRPPHPMPLSPRPLPAAEGIQNYVTPAQVQQMAAKYIQSDKATIVVVGDKKVIAEQVAPLREGLLRIHAGFRTSPQLPETWNLKTSSSLGPVLKRRTTVDQAIATAAPSIDTAANQHRPRPDPAEPRCRSRDSRGASRSRSVSPRGRATAGRPKTS